MKDVVGVNIELYPSDQCLGYRGVCAKSWIGESHGFAPMMGRRKQLRQDIAFRNVYMRDNIRPIAVDTTLTDLPDIKGRLDVKASPAT